MDFESFELDENQDLVLATSIGLHSNFSEIYKQGNVPKKQEKLFIEQTNKEFKLANPSSQSRAKEEHDWNTVFKPDQEGTNRFITFDGITGLGAVMVDKDNNGKADGVSIFLKDNQLDDLNPDPFIIDDPWAYPNRSTKLIVDTSSKLDGNPALRVEGVPGTAYG